MLVHGSNLQQKQNHRTKYLDSKSRRYLAEIRIEYDKWHQANVNLVGPKSAFQDNDKDVVAQRIKLLEAYKNFIDQQEYAENFDSRSNLHSTVLEEFLYYLFRDLVADFGKKALIGKSHAFKDIFFAPPNYRGMTERAYASIERKDHDFIIGATVETQLRIKSQDEGDKVSGSRIGELPGLYDVKIENDVEMHYFDIPAVAIECKTFGFP